MSSTIPFMSDCPLAVKFKQKSNASFAERTPVNGLNKLGSGIFEGNCFRAGTGYTGYRDRWQAYMRGATGVGLSLLSHERRYRRFKLRYPVRLLFRTDDGVSAIDTFSKDVSIGGLSLQCPVYIPEHSEVSFVISLHGRALRPIELMGEGEIVRVEPAEAGQEFSVAVACQNPITQIEPYFPESAN